VGTGAADRSAKGIAPTEVFAVLERGLRSPAGVRLPPESLRQYVPAVLAELPGRQWCALVWAHHRHASCADLAPALLYTDSEMKTVPQGARAERCTTASTADPAKDSHPGMSIRQPADTACGRDPSHYDWTTSIARSRRRSGGSSPRPAPRSGPTVTWRRLRSCPTVRCRQPWWPPSSRHCHIKQNGRCRPSHQPHASHVSWGFTRTLWLRSPPDRLT
jgi:hypothetical protein